MFDFTWVDLFLALSSFLAGAMNAIAGGGTLLTFPALLSALDDGKVANATSTVALLPGSLASAWGYRREMKEERPWITLLIVPSLLGSIVGALLMTLLPKEVFERLVPWLILLAALLFMAQPTLAKWSGNRGGTDAKPSPRARVLLVAAQFVIAVYGGYFGAGIGILMLSSLGFMGLSDIHKMNAVKTVLASAINLIAAVIFVFIDLTAGRTIDWRVAPLMIAAAIAGGYLAARVARQMNRNVVRWLVIAIGLGLAGYYFVDQYWPGV